MRRNNLIWLLPLGVMLAMDVDAEAKSEENVFKPWRLSVAADFPGWLKLSGHHRSRYEMLDGQFRAGRRGSDRILVFRTALKGEIKLDDVEFTAEVVDSRQELADDRTPLNTGIINTLELVQGHATLNFADLLQEGSRSRLQIGRQTIDIGSRRLVARNRFRNTLNNFTGINGSWTAASGERVQVFYVLPVNRLPFDSESLLGNDSKFDEENFDVQFYGLYSRFPELISNVAGEFYLFGLHEDDDSSWATRHRNLYTTGFRFNRKPAQGQFDFELESVLQIGESRASKAATDTTDLDHSAHFYHAQVGYTFDRRWSPRLLLQFDYASGDEDPNDDKNNRFDTLYGARRFEFGPTGIYGAFARSNLISPGYRLLAQPREKLSIVIAHRFYWLASDRDAWTAGGLRDVTGNSDSYLGNQAEIRIRRDVISGNLRIETGVTHLSAGEFLETAPNGNGEGDATYAYLQTVFTF